MADSSQVYDIHRGRDVGTGRSGSGPRCLGGEQQRMAFYSVRTIADRVYILALTRRDVEAKEE